MNALKLSREQVGLLFPAFLETDADLRVVVIGPALQRLVKQDLVGESLTAFATFEQPLGDSDVDVLVLRQSSLKLRLASEDLLLRGVVLKLACGYLFCLSHAVERPQQLLQRGLRMEDFSPADGGLPLALALGLKDELLSETRDLVADLAQARDAAVAGSRAKSVFLANMSHEIRTPLNGVTGVAGALARTKLTADQRDLLSVIQASGRTLERLLSDVLDVAQGESGQLALHEAPCDLRAAVEAAVFPLRLQAAEKGLAFDLAFDLSDHPLVVIDETRLKQVLVCLVSNAIRFTPQGGVHITVNCGSGPGEALVMTLKVADTGVGFDEGQAAALYAPFEQASAGPGASSGGLGLGLAIAKTLCERMGGDIAASSRLGVGSLFQVRLPVRPLPVTATGADEPGGAIANEHGRPFRVLLAEDHPTNQTVIRLILEPHGVNLVIAGDGLEALARFKAAEFDLILMDLRMPGLNGLELTSAIRSLEFSTLSRRTPIIIVSADALPEHRRAGLDAGADHYLPKPITPESLLEAIDKVLSDVDTVVEF